MLRRAALALGLLVALPAARVLAGDPPPVPAPGFWTPDELTLIDRGLNVLNCDRKDLQFQKRPLDDPFRLSIVNRVLDDPLSIGPIAEGWDESARNGLATALLAQARTALDLPEEMPDHDADSKIDLRGLPESVREPMLYTLAAVERERDVGAKIHASLGSNADAILSRALLTQREEGDHPTDGAMKPGGASNRLSMYETRTAGSIQLTTD